MISLAYAGFLALFGVLLANYVLYVRLRGQQLPDWRAEAAQRVQSNFVENVPMALVLLLGLDLAGLKPVTIHTFGTLLIGLRVLHAYGLALNEGANYPRLIGAQGTFLLLSVMGVAAIYQALELI